MNTVVNVEKNDRNTKTAFFKPFLYVCSFYYTRVIKA